MSQTQRVTGVATKVEQIADLLKIKYHNTVVVEASDSHIILRTGGWKTNTTKTRMNQASNQFELGYQVYQKNFDWFVTYKGETHEFNGNNLTLDRGVV